MLKFFYGVMGSSKTAQALIRYYNVQQIKVARAFLLKPSIDTRSADVSSRVGLSAPCLSLDEHDTIRSVRDIGSSLTIYPQIFIVIDEAQFLTPTQVEELRELANLKSPNVNIYCYGLKANFQTKLFSGSARLIELADEIEEIPTFCACGKKATQNVRFKDGLMQLTGPEIEIGDSKYKALCPSCLEHEEKVAKFHEARLEMKKERETGFSQTRLIRYTTEAEEAVASSTIAP